MARRRYAFRMSPTTASLDKPSVSWCVTATRLAYPTAVNAQATVDERPWNELPALTGKLSAIRR